MARVIGYEPPDKFLKSMEKLGAPDDLNVPRQSKKGDAIGIALFCQSAKLYPTSTPAKSAQHPARNTSARHPPPRA